jgi:hypothetical protein
MDSLSAAVMHSVFNQFSWWSFSVEASVSHQFPKWTPKKNNEKHHSKYFVHAEKEGGKRKLLSASGLALQLIIFVVDPTTSNTNISHTYALKRNQEHT